MSGIKDCFISRWGADGVILEADFGQIEQVVQAFRSGDTNMCNDIRKGIDMHCKKLAFAESMPYEEIVRLAKVDKVAPFPKKRTDIKGLTFQRAYGAGANAIALSLDMGIELVKDFIKAEEAMYPGVPLMQQAWIDEVEASRVPTTKRTDAGRQAGRGQMRGITGRIYTFYEYDTPEWLAQRTGKLTGFKPTQIKNYEIQGFAGELLRLALGRLYRILKGNPDLRNKALLINTVHDSILLDVHKSVLTYAAQVVQWVMEGTPMLVEQVFGFKFDLPITVEIEAGSSWGSKKLIEV